MKEALKRFQKEPKPPSDQRFEALDHAYEQAIDRIKAQRPGFRELAIRVLLWLTSTKRLLTTLELQTALAIELRRSEIDADNFEDREIMVSVCGGLATADEGSDIIQLVHYTA